MRAKISRGSPNSNVFKKIRFLSNNWKFHGYDHQPSLGVSHMTFLRTGAFRRFFVAFMFCALNFKACKPEWVMRQILVLVLYSNSVHHQRLDWICLGDIAYKVVICIKWDTMISAHRWSVSRLMHMYWTWHLIQRELFPIREVDFPYTFRCSCVS